MSLLNYFDSHQKKHNKGYFAQLLKIAKADGLVSDVENSYLYRIGKKLGFTDEEIIQLFANPGEPNYHFPVELAERFEQLYEIIKMTLADGIITEEEKKVAGHFVVAAGFNSEEAPLLMDIIIEGIKNGIDAEDLLHEYKKKKRAK